MVRIPTETTQIYTQVNIRALAAVHNPTYPPEQGADVKDVGLLSNRLADDARGKNE